MRKIGIKALKNDLSKHLRAAESGETVLVTDRGKVIAEIIPPRPAPEGTEAERGLADLIRRGLVTPAKTQPGGRLPPRKMPLMTFEELMADLAADREDR